jgi:hypothetical protein
MQKSFDIYSDPGHAWCKVPFSVLRELGIVDKISYFSYQRNAFAYLEEDGDLTQLIIALRERGITPKFKEHICRERRSKIRSYFCYTPQTVQNYFALGGK